MSLRFAGLVRTCVRSTTPGNSSRYFKELSRRFVVGVVLLAALGCGGSSKSASASLAADGGEADATAVGDTAQPTAAEETVRSDETDSPLSAADATTAVRKVKGLLTGGSVSDAEIARVVTDGQAGLKQLIRSYMNDAATSGAFRDKLLLFFRNAFQQTGFQPGEDFQNQLLQYGGFDFVAGPLFVGDDAYARIVQNLQDSFALTAWQLVQDGRPFTEVLTTQRFMLTTALKSLYLQIEAPNDRAFGLYPAPGKLLSWKIDYSGKAIPLEQSLDPKSANYLVFDDQPPASRDALAMITAAASKNLQTCAAGSGVDASGAAISSATFSGQSFLFQRLLGQTPPLFSKDGKTICYPHPAKPYFTQQDLSDWQWVSIRAPKPGETAPAAYDLPRLRGVDELPLQLPRIGFFTTPAFLALWSTNDSNQHRVTANQTLLVAYGSSYSSSSSIVPLSTAGLDADHAVSGGECYGCHVGLDPLRAFWSNQLDFNDRNDFLTVSSRMGMPNPRPSTQGGVLAFLDINAHGANIAELGALLAQASDQFADKPLNAFAVELAQKLCYFANARACDKSDPEFRRVVSAFQERNFDLKLLIEELFASPLITGARATKTFKAHEVPLSITRRDHFCAALSQRLGKPDICALAVPRPDIAQAGTARLAASIPADGFSRGSELPIVPSDPNLFQRAGVEMLCENIAELVVDAPTDPVFRSSDVAGALAQMLEQLMGYPPSHPQRTAALQILQDHYDTARKQQKASATYALRSAFVLACEAPTLVAQGL